MKLLPLGIFLGIIVVGIAGYAWYSKPANSDTVSGPLSNFLGTTKIATLQDNQLFVRGFDSIVLSPDTKTIAYSFHQPSTPTDGNAPQYVVIGNKKIGPYSKVGPLVFSPDGSIIAFKANSNQVITVDGIISGQYNVRAGRVYKSVGLPHFLPDGKSVTYYALEGNHFTIVKGQQQWGSFLWQDVYVPSGLVGALVVNSSGDKAAYVTKQGDKKVVVIQDLQGSKTLGKADDGISSLAFNPVTNEITYVAQENNEKFVVIGTKKSKSYTTIPQIYFNVTDGSVIYKAWQGTTSYLVNNGNETLYPAPNRKCFDVGDKSIAKSPDGLTLAIIVDNCTGAGPIPQKNWLMLETENGSRLLGPKYDTVTPPIFSGDGLYVGYGAVQKNELWWVAQTVNSK